MAHLCSAALLKSIQFMTKSKALHISRVNFSKTTSFPRVMSSQFFIFTETTITNTRALKKRTVEKDKTFSTVPFL